VVIDLRTAAGVDRFEYAEGEERPSLSLTFAPEDRPGEVRA
jgi:hypothetical protein